MKPNEIKKRLELVDDRLPRLWERYPVFTAVLFSGYIVCLGIGFALGKFL